MWVMKNNAVSYNLNDCHFNACIHFQCPISKTNHNICSYSLSFCTHKLGQAVLCLDLNNNMDLHPLKKSTATAWVKVKKGEKHREAWKYKPTRWMSGCVGVGVLFLSLNGHPPILICQPSNPQRFFVLAIWSLIFKYSAFCRHCAPPSTLHLSATAPQPLSIGCLPPLEMRWYWCHYLPRKTEHAYT